MPTACLNQTGARVHLVSERLEVRGPNPETGREELLREIPLRDLERLVMLESVQISSAALAALLRSEIPISVLGWNGRFLGAFHPASNSHGLARLRQYQRTQEREFAMDMARRLIAAKLYNQRRVLQRLAASRDAAADAPTSDGAGRGEVRATLDWLESFFPALKRAGGLDELRGCEGASTARYFQTWAGFLPAEFPFERRSTRPPLNAVNACISFGATLLYTETAAFVHAHGLDAALGLLHATENGRWSLALDLLEPFRPVLVEALALDLFSHAILGTGHFESRDGGVFLNEEGRKRFFLQYERRMERQFMSESAGHRTTLRQQLENQAVLYKSALEEPARYEPFLMN